MRLRKILTVARLWVITLILPLTISRAEEPATGTAKEPGAAMILSTGDNLFYYKWFPIDSPAGIGASFDIFKSHHNVNRIVWRGAQAQWMAIDNVFRPEAEEIADLYIMEMDLETKDRLSHKAAEEARRRGLAFWGYMPLFEVGASADAVSMAGFGPYNFEEKIRAEHPEYRLYDRAGISSGSTIEFGYPQVREAFLKRYDQMFTEGGDFSIYDGIVFYTYVENFFPRHSDQFIYSDIAVKDFKQRYGVDVLKEPFDMDKYLELRGEYVTQYLRELRKVFNKHGRKLAFYIDARQPETPQRWPSYPDLLVPGRIKMDWKTWVKEGLVDEIGLRDTEKRELVQPFVDALEGTNIHLSMMTSRIPPQLTFLRERGVSRHIWAPELASEFPPENRPVSELDSGDRLAVMSVLRQVREGSIEVPVDKLTALFTHQDLIVRRQAVAAVLGRRMNDAIPALEKAAMDPENSFRCVVIDALGTLHGPNTVAVIGKSLETYPVFAMRLVARTAWSMMIAERADDLVALYRQTNSPYVRATIIEMLSSKRAVPAIDAIPAFRPLLDDAAKDSNQNVRNMAAFAAAYYPDKDSAELLLEMLNDPTEVVQNAAAFSLGEVARRLDNRATRERIFDRLAQQAKLYTANSKRGDQEWGYRVVAEALIFGFGPRGERHVVETLNGDDTKLADLAWKVLFHPNDGWNFYPIDIAEAEKLTAYHPGPNRMGLPRQKYAPAPRVEIMRQTFAGFVPDPTGQLGDIWDKGGKWIGLDESVQLADQDGKAVLEIGVGKSGNGPRLVGTVGYDLADGRMKNRLRGHFPASPTPFGLVDGIAELSLEVRRSGPGASLQVSLSPDAKSTDLVGFIIAGDGKVKLQSNTKDAVADTTQAVAQDDWHRATLKLDFNTGKASVQVGEGSAMTFPFDNNRQYRALVVSVSGDSGGKVQLGDLRLTQSVE